jgi:purine-nucleoside phosphorylase
MTTLQKIKEALAFLETKTTFKPSVGVVLGSGLGNFGKQFKAEVSIPYEDIPHFPKSTVEGHSGQLLFGYIGTKQVVCMSGRFHYYEGYNMEEVVFPIRLFKYLGVEHCIISNAAGGTNKNFKVGDIMFITDHISFFAINPLLGKNEAEFGPRFPDMTEPYKKDLIALANNVAAENKIEVKHGVYCGVTGPTFETKAEYKLILAIGGDAVGMSTVGEVIAANHIGMKVFAMSVITDLGIREEDNIITHQEVLEAATAAEPKMSTIVIGLINAL